MTYIKFRCLPVKGRIEWTQQRLIELGYLNEGDSKQGVRDRTFIKALTKFQGDNNLSRNGQVNEKEFTILNE